MAGHEFANLLGRICTRLNGCPHTADIALHNGCHKRTANAHSLEDLDVSRLGHRIGGLNEAHKSLGLNQSNRCIHTVPMLSKRVFKFDHVSQDITSLSIRIQSAGKRSVAAALGRL